MITFNYKDIPKGKFLFAVSGGADSVACCHFLAKNNDFCIIHINNHLIPGDELAAAKVEEFSQYLNLDCYIFDSVTNPNGKDIENWARQERLNAFNYVCQKFGYSDILTAHGLHDIVSGYLINCLKGVPDFQPIPKITEFGNFTIRRPFLNNNKNSFIDYVKSNNLERFVVEDELNQDMSLMRNWVREKLFPLIEEKTNLTSMVRRKFLS